MYIDHFITKTRTAVKCQPSPHRLQDRYLRHHHIPSPISCYCLQQARQASPFAFPCFRLAVGTRKLYLCLPFPLRGPVSQPEGDQNKKENGDSIHTLDPPTTAGFAMGEVKDEAVFLPSHFFGREQFVIINY